MLAPICRALLLLFCLHGPLATAAPSPYIVDGDGDSVSDEIDDCPYTHPGSQVDAKGCPLKRDDADLDGVDDDDDDCPYSAAGAVIDAKGCARDTDFDGIANGLDRCPTTPLPQVVDRYGCAAGERQEAVARAPGPAVRALSSARVIETAAKVSQPVEIVASTTAPTPKSVTLTADPLPEPMRVASTTTFDATAALESPKLLLRFSRGSNRLSDNDLASIAGYAKVFARRLNNNSHTFLRIQAYADQREGDADSVAVSRKIALRAALVEKGIAAIRIEAESSVIFEGDTKTNRRAEAEIVER